MARPVHFEIHADDPERAVEFYSAVLGWTFTKWEGPADYWLVTTGPDNEPGINGGLVRRQGGSGDAVIAYVCTMDVPSVDDYVDRVVGAGGMVALPKMAVPGVGWLAYCKDTEGNIFGFMQADETAA
jgi:uncharacterized protein